MITSVGRLFVAIFLLACCVRVKFSTASSYCDNPDNSALIDGCDPTSRDPATSGCFTKKKKVFGINVWSTAETPSWAIDYQVSVLLEMLDANEDGEPDDPKLVEAFLSNEWSKDLAVITCRGNIGSGPLKDLFWSVTRTYGQQELDDIDPERGSNEFKDVTLEETHHMIHVGYENMYFETFGNGLVSALSLGIDQAMDDCEAPHECAPNCENYECSCNDSPCTEVTQYDCRFIEDSCNGIYHYSDVMNCNPETDGGACQGSEGLYMPWATLNGMFQSEASCQDMKSQWEICTGQNLASNPLTSILYELTIGEHPSQAELGYRLPSRLPDGKYQVGRELDCGLFTEKAGCLSMNSCLWTIRSGNTRACISLPICKDKNGKIEFKLNKKKKVKWTCKKIKTKAKKVCRKKTLRTKTPIFAFCPLACKNFILEKELQSLPCTFSD